MPSPVTRTPDPISPLAERGDVAVPAFSAWQAVLDAEDDRPLMAWCRDWGAGQRVLAWWAYDEAARRADALGATWTPALAAATKALRQVLSTDDLSSPSPDGRPGPNLRLDSLAPWLSSLTESDWEGELAPLLEWGAPGISLVETIAWHAGAMPLHALTVLCRRGYGELLTQNRALAAHGPSATFLASFALDCLTVSMEVMDSESEPAFPEGLYFHGLNMLASLIHLGWSPPDDFPETLSALIDERRQSGGRGTDGLVLLLYRLTTPPIPEAIHRRNLAWARRLSEECVAERATAIGAPWLTEEDYVEWVRDTRSSTRGAQEILDIPRAMAYEAVRQALVGRAMYYSDLLFKLPSDLFWQAIGRTAVEEAPQWQDPSRRLVFLCEALGTVSENDLAVMPQDVCAALLAHRAPAVREWAMTEALPNPANLPHML